MQVGSLACLNEPNTHQEHSPWTDLSTTDQDAAKKFYGELFGWDADDQPVGDGMTYSMMNIGGKPVAGIALQNDMQRQFGAPPAWNSYVTVESAPTSRRTEPRSWAPT